MIDLTRDEVLALLSMTGGVPESEQPWLVAHRASATYAISQTARAKLVAFLADHKGDMRRGWWHGWAIWATASAVDVLFVHSGVVSFAGLVAGLVWMQTNWGAAPPGDTDG